MKPTSGLSVAGLICLVVGSMVGGGIFSLPQAFGEATAVVGALVGWGVAECGRLALALVFLMLSRRRPEVNAGIYAYPREGFGDYIGFLGPLGLLGERCSWQCHLFGALRVNFGAFLSDLRCGQYPCRGHLCLGDFMVVSFRAPAGGVKEASAVNVAVTLAKVVPLALFLLIVIASLHPATLCANLFTSTGANISAMSGEVRQTVLVLVFVFLGVEGASVYSRLARKPEDVGRATIIGFLVVLALLILVSILPYGILPRAELAELHNPSVAGVLSSLVGVSGDLLVSVGVLISVLGAFLAWSLLAAEVLFAAAQTGLMPTLLGGINRAGAPAPAILWTTTAAQISLVLLTLLAYSVFRFAIELTICVALIPYVLVAGFSIKLVLAEHRAGRPVAWHEYGASLVATLYTLAAIILGGSSLLPYACSFFTMMTVLYVFARRERGQRLFVRGEWMIAAAIGLVSIVALSHFISMATAGR